MKRLYSFLFFAFTLHLAQAQVVDTVLFENFQEVDDPSVNWPLFPVGDDTTWVNSDADGLTPFDGSDYSYQWFTSDFFYNATDSVTGITNYCIVSLSYMQNSATGNRNWLILPPIHVTDDSYTLHWKSAPFQLPRYMDGYSVLVSTNGNDIYATTNPFTNLLFRAASMESITGDGENTDLSNYTFTPGYIHADSIRDTAYTVLWAPGDSTLLRGLLEPHSVSLGAYAGSTIYIAFLHDSDDDYYLALDDFLVTRTQTSGVSQIEQDLRLRTYPNPAEDYLNVLYRLPAAARVSLRVSEMSGRVVWEKTNLQQAGEQSQDVPVAQLPAGQYSLTLNVGGELLSRVFSKR